MSSLLKVWIIFWLTAFPFREMASDENESFASQRPSKTGFVVCFNVPLNKSAFVLRSSKVPKPEKSTFKVTVQNLAEIKLVVETFSKIMNAKTFPMYLQGDVGVHKRLESSPSISGRTRSTSGSCSSWIASVSASCSKMWTVAIPGKGRSNCRKQTTSERFPGLFELSKLENNFANGFFSFWTYFHSFVSRILESK